MEISLISRNIVVVGVFMPSKFDKFFFVKNNIFSEEELESSIFNEKYVFVNTGKINLFITPVQLTITLTDLRLEDDLHKALLRIIENSTNDFNSIGINYSYYMFAGETLEELSTVSKRYFYQDNKLTNDFFNTEDAAFGYYVSKNFKHSRLKLDVKPGIVTNPEQKTHNVLTFDFNFHSELQSQNGKDLILNILNDAPEYNEESKNIMKIYNE